MRAVTWQAKGKVSTESIPDPIIKEPNDILIKVEVSGLSSWDLYLYKELSSFLTPGTVLGREAVGIVVECGSDINNLKVGDRVVVPSNVACGSCLLCLDGFQSQCETNQNYDKHFGASILGAGSLYGQIQGTQAEYLRVPEAQYGPIKIPLEVNPYHYIYLSELLPAAWQALEYSDLKTKDNLVILGLGALGLAVLKLALRMKLDKIIVVEEDAKRRERAKSLGALVVDPQSEDSITRIKDLTYKRGADAVVETSEMSSKRRAKLNLNPNMLNNITEMRALSALTAISRGQGDSLGHALQMVRRGGVLSVAGALPPTFEILPSLYMFDHQITLRMGHPNVRRWSDFLLDVLNSNDDNLKMADMENNILSLEEAEVAYHEGNGDWDKILFVP